MNDVIRWLFSLEQLEFGAEGVRLGLARPMPAWAWFLIIAATVAVSAWSYWRLAGPATARAALASARALVVLLLAILACGPELVRPNVVVESDWILVLADRSASLTIPDAPGAPPGTTRDEQLRQALRDAWPMWSRLAQRRHVVWLGFDAGAYELTSAEPEAPTDAAQIELGPPTGRRTAIGRALEQALRRAAARPVAAVVVLSDGRSLDTPSRQTLSRLRAERIPVFTVPLGDPSPVDDLALRRIDAPSLAFVDDIVPVTVTLDRLGEPDQTGRPDRIRLIDRDTGLVLDQRDLPPSPPGHAQSVALRHRPATGGQRVWIVELIPGGHDLIADNNRAEVSIELVDRPLRVVYFDGYPRWERHYLTRLLLRERSIQSSSLMLAPNRRYRQEGDVTLESLPRSPEEWAGIDVVILGDLRPELFSREQLEQLREHVAVRGAGLLWIGGPGATPQAWHNTPLADLLPFRLSAQPGTAATALAPWPVPVTMARTPSAERLGVLELAEAAERDADGWPARLSDPATGWSRLRWAQRIDPELVKPAAEVLAVARPVMQPTASRDDASARSQPPLPQAAPLVLTMRFGSGRVVYVGTDEIWRWRYGRGETLPERFWLPLIRLLGRESLARAAQPAILDVTPARADVDRPVRVAVRLIDQALVDARPIGVQVRIEPLDRDAQRSAPDEPHDTIDPSITPGEAPIELRLIPDNESAGGAAFAATWVPTRPGRFRVRVVDPLLAGANLQAMIDVQPPDHELRHPDADHILLHTLSEQTDGAVLLPHELRTLPDRIPNREIAIATDPDVETLWDTPAALLALVVLLTAEWMGRRLIRLS